MFLLSNPLLSRCNPHPSSGKTLTGALRTSQTSAYVMLCRRRNRNKIQPMRPGLTMYKLNKGQFCNYTRPKITKKKKQQQKKKKEKQKYEKTNILIFHLYSTYTYRISRSCAVLDRMQADVKA